MKQSRVKVNRALWITLGAGVIGWVLFVLSVFSNLSIDLTLSSDELYGPNAIAIVRPATYLLFAAIAVVGIAALLTRRAASNASVQQSVLASSVRDFAGTVLIVAMVLSVVSAISVFMGNLFEGVSDASILQRILISYLPIVLYTALVITLLLAGFVFAKRVPQATHSRSSDSDSTAEANTTTEAHTSEEAHSVAADHPGSGVQRATAFAYTVPIVSLAIALIFGLIVYDITQTALEAWIWVIVVFIVGFGIVFGTWFAARAYAAHKQHGVQPAGASVGAKVLNLVLSIVFAGVVTSMSLGYGASAIEKLRFQPSLALSAYSNNMEQKEPAKNEDLEADISDVRVFVNGSSLKSGTDLVVTFEPGSIELVTERVNANGWASAEFSLPDNLPAKAGVIQLEATDANNNAMQLQLQVVVDSDDTITMNETYVDFTTDDPKLLPVNVDWVVGDLIPPLVLLFGVIGMLYFTLNTRNPESFTESVTMQQSDLNSSN